MFTFLCVMSFLAQVLYSYSIGFVYILTGLLCVGGLGPAVAFCSEVRILLKYYIQNGQSLTITVLMSPTHPNALHSECIGSLPSQHPVKTYGYAFFFSLTGYFGISFVLALIKLFGALLAVTGEFSRLLQSDTIDSS